MLEVLAKFGFGALLVSVTLAALVDLLQHPQFQAGLFVLAVLVGLLWWAWCQLPEWFRKFVWRFLKRKEHDDER